MDLHFKVLGEGEPIIILHGLFGMLDNWKSIGKALADEYMVVLVDLRNHGRSPHSEEMSYPLMAQDLARLMEKQWYYDATVVGHSMGGKAAMQLAGDFPEFVGRLVVVDIGPKAYPPRHQTVIKALKAVDFSRAESRSDIQEQMAEHLDDESVILFLMKNIRRTKEGYAWKMNLEAIVNNYDNLGADISLAHPFEGASVFIRGANSDYILDDDFEDIQTCFPKAEMVTIEDAGHWVHADQPKQMIAVLRRLIDTN